MASFSSAAAAGENRDELFRLRDSGNRAGCSFEVARQEVDRDSLRAWRCRSHPSDNQRRRGLCRAVETGGTSLRPARTLVQSASKERVIGAEEAVDSLEDAEESARLVAIVIGDDSRNSSATSRRSIECARVMPSRPTANSRQLSARHQLEFGARDDVARSPQSSGRGR